MIFLHKKIIVLTLLVLSISYPFSLFAQTQLLELFKPKIESTTQLLKNNTFAITQNTLTDRSIASPVFIGEHIMNVYCGTISIFGFGCEEDEEIKEIEVEKTPKEQVLNDTILNTQNIQENVFEIEKNNTQLSTPVSSNVESTVSSLRIIERIVTPVYINNTIGLSAIQATLNSLGEKIDNLARTPPSIIVSGGGGISANSFRNLRESLQSQIDDVAAGGIANLNSFTTTNLSEGTNLYYTDTRFDSAFGLKTTSDLIEGANLYFTTARAITALTNQNISLFTNDSNYLSSIAGLNISTLNNDSNFISNLSSFTTDNLSQGTTNLYSQWTTSGSSIFYSGGNVGVGTNDPQFPLSVVDELSVHTFPYGNPEINLTAGFDISTIYIESDASNLLYISTENGTGAEAGAIESALHIRHSGVLNNTAYAPIWVNAVGLKPSTSGNPSGWHINNTIYNDDTNFVYRLLDDSIDSSHLFKISNNTLLRVGRVGGINTVNVDADFNVYYSGELALDIDGANYNYRIGDLEEVESGTIYEIDSIYGHHLLKGGNVGIGTTSPLSKLQINSGATSDKGLVVQGFAGQTANLQEWQNDAGTVLSAIGKDGTIGIGANPNTTFQLDINNPSRSGFRFTSGTRSLAFSNFAGDLNYINSSGANLRFVTTDATAFEFWTTNTRRMSIGAGGNVHLGTPNSLLTSYQLSIQPTVATNKGLVVRGFAGQTANLQEWQDSAGAVLGVVNADGKVGINNSSPDASLTVDDIDITNHGIIGNVHIGKNAGNIGADPTANENVGIGLNTLTSLTTGRQNVALGYSALSGNQGAFFNLGIGSYALQSNTGGNHNVAVGVQSQRFITGGSNVAIGSYSVQGANGNANVNRNVGIGQNTLRFLQAGADDNTAIGNNTGTSITTGTDNVFLGSFSGSNTTTGSRNILIGFGVQGTSVTANDELNIGNTIYGNLSSGNVGIGTTNPQNNLVVNGSSGTQIGVSINNINTSGYSVFRIGTETAAAVGLGIHQFNSSYGGNGGAYTPLTSTFSAFESGGLKLHANHSSGVIRFYAGGSAAANERMVITNTGKVGIGTTDPTQKLHVAGNARFESVGSGAYAFDLNLTSDGTLTTSASDEKLKTNIQSLDASSTLDKILRLNPSTFDWKSDGSHDMGLIAQEVEEIFPELVFVNPTDGYKGVNYSRFIPLIIASVQELVQRINGFAQRFETKELCLEDVCITKTELEQLLSNQQVQSTPNTGTQEDITEEEPVTEDVGEEEVDTTPIEQSPEDQQEVVENLVEEVIVSDTPTQEEAPSSEEIVEEPQEEPVIEEVVEEKIEESQETEIEEVVEI